MRKVVYTLVVDNYFPELCELTLKNHEEYACKIGADFQIITERKKKDWPPTYEKTQIHDLGGENDWSLHIDADILISPKLWDVTERLDPFTVGMYSIYDPALYFKPDQYFARDGRRVGVCSAFCAVPRACHDLWTPFDMPFDEAKERVLRVHGIDDYCFSRNLARYGLRWKFFFEEGDDFTLIQHLGIGGTVEEEKKESMLNEAKKILASWE